MARLKNIRGNNTYLVDGAQGDNPKLMAQILEDGRESLYLEYYGGYRVVESKNGNTYKKIERTTHRLGLYLWQAPRTPMERQHNKEILEVAKRLRFERGQELLESSEGYRLKKRRDLNFYDWYDEYVANYTKTDKNKLVRAKVLFIECMEQTPEFAKYAKRMKPDQLSREMVRAFTEYLQMRFNGETPHTLYERFKKVILAAVDRDVIRKNPCKGVSIKIDKNRLTKDILSPEEVRTLLSTEVPRQSREIRRAFTFCLCVGMRFCDVKDLQYSSVDYGNNVLRFEQSKTKGHSSASVVTLYLDEVLLSLIGRPTAGRSEKIFKLPSHTMCLKSLSRWVKHAGIDKHITWHCARHTCATNMLRLSDKPNIKNVATVLGHSDLRHTEKYIRAVAEDIRATTQCLTALLPSDGKE